jgi:arsenate reductase
MLVFVCTGNAGRSQMAAAFFNAMAHPSHAFSAGTVPAAEMDANVVAVMAERRIDLGTARPRPLTPDLLEDTPWLITMGCGNDYTSVPVARRDEWQIDDPARQPIELVREIADVIERRVWKLIVREGWVRLQPRGEMRALHARKPES